LVENIFHGDAVIAIRIDKRNDIIAIHMSPHADLLCDDEDGCVVILKYRRPGVNEANGE
jgi:hypothetical protein